MDIHECFFFFSNKIREHFKLTYSYNTLLWIATSNKLAVDSIELL